MAMIPRVKKDATAAAPAANAETAAPAAAPAPTSAPAPAAATNTPGPAAAAAAPAAATAVATQAPRAVAVAGKPKDYVADYKDQMELEWNTLHRIQANNGNFLDMENNKTPFGNEIVIQLMSFQDGWQISPGTDDPADKDLVRYSKDGKVTDKGEDCQAYLAELIESGRDKAKLAQRVMLAGVVEEAPGDKTGKLVQEIVQIDLSTTSKGMFDRYRMLTAYQISKGMLDPAAVGRIKMTAKPTSANGRTWTVVEFAVALPTA